MERILNSLKAAYYRQILRSAAFLIIMFFVGSASAGNYAQNTIISVNLVNVELKTVLKNIEKQSEFYFMYNDKVDVSQKVTVILKNKTIYEILDRVFEKTGIDYEIINKQIVLNPEIKDNKTEENTITGYVFDDAGEPLPGVTVVEKGTTNGTFTDEFGYFTIKVAETDVILIFSFIGFVTQEVEAGAKTSINVTLLPELTDIEEVIVVGYGTSSKKFVTGAISNVNSDDISNTVSSGIEGSLQGKATGLQVIQNSGTPGSAVTLKIRGTASLFGGSQPLYVIDGIPMTTGDYSQIGFEGQGIDAGMDINPNDIESISILKDASASIYGARAANGVIVITTKKGKSGKTKISYRGYGGIQQEWKRLDLLNAEEWKEFVSETDPLFVAGLDDQTIDTDWQDEVFRIAPIMNHELSASGGNDKTNLFISGGYFDQKGIVLGSDYKKYSGRINVDHKISNNFSFSIKSSNSYIINNRIVGDKTINGVLPNAISKPPVYAIKDDLGNYLEEGFWDNPVAIANEVTNEAISLRNISSIELKYRITPSLTFNNQTAFDFYNLGERRYEPTTVDRGFESNGIAIDAKTSVNKLLQQSTLNYIYSINNDHNFDILIGYSIETRDTKFNRIRAINFPSDDLEYITSAGTIDEATGGAYKEALASFFGRLKYNFLNKYIIEATVRSDGSDKFDKSYRFVPLPGFSFAWRLGEERFLKNINFINELKLRAGFGITGNDQVPSYTYMNIYGSGQNYYGEPGIYPLQIPNPDITWEKSQNYNVGLDVEMFNTKLDLTLEAYYILTKDLLIPRPIPGSSGFTVMYDNVGTLENKGIELSISSLNIDRELKWQTSLNMSFNQNKVLELYNDQPITLSTDDGYGRGNNAVVVGQPVGVFYMLKSLGVDPSTGDLLIENVSGEGISTDDDRQVAGDPNPLFTGGFTNIISYKGIELRAFFQFSYGNDIFNGTRQYAEAMTFGNSDNQLSTIRDRWQQPGDQTTVPRINGTYNNAKSSHYIEDGSYLRLKEITLSYMFPKKILEKTRIFSGIKVYMKGQNVLTFTNYSGLDPEVNYAGINNIEQGVDFFTFPQARVFLIGLNLNF